MTKQEKAAYDKAYTARNRERRNACSRAWNAKNKERCSGHRKKYYLKHRARRNASILAWRHSKPEYRLAHNLRNRLTRALKGLNKSESTQQLLGCSIGDFRLHIESNWEPGMSWDNYGHGVGKWGLDHMIPCAIFDLSKPEHQRRCFHFSNIRPMWAIANIKKGKKLVTNQYNLL